MEEGVLIDTDILIDYVKDMLDLPLKRLCITEIVLHESIRWVDNVEKAKEILEETFIILLYDDRIIVKAAKM